MAPDHGPFLFGDRARAETDVLRPRVDYARLFAASKILAGYVHIRTGLQVVRDLRRHNYATALRIHAVVTRT